MPYCSNCGAELKGARIFCPECRYRHNPQQIDLIARKARVAGTSASASRDDEPPTRRPAPSARTRGPAPEEEEPEVYEPRKAASTMKEETEFVRDGKRVTILKEGCGYCDQNAVRRCFFCYSPVCDVHTDTLKIFVRSNPFGKAVLSCPDCAAERHGRQPTPQEAEKASMFFKVKPYHEWRRIRG